VGFQHWQRFTTPVKSCVIQIFLKPLLRQICSTLFTNASVVSCLRSISLEVSQQGFIEIEKICWQKLVFVRSAGAKNEAENLTHQIHGKCFA